MHNNDVFLSKPQMEFITSNYKYPAMVAGYAAGKTEAAIQRLFRLKIENPKNDVAYYLPTYDLVNTIAFPRMEELFNRIGIRYTINRNDKTVTIPKYGKIILRTMDRPERIVGYEVADSIADELDTLPIDKAREVWQKIIARNRQKKVNGSVNTVAVATTPEGFKFVYERWKKRGGDEYQIIKASTYSNAHNLPADYIQTLENDYPEQLLQAYLHGEFVNLTSGSVYSEFDRKTHFSNEVIKTGEPLHIGMDFNVGKMSGAVFVLRNNIPHAVDELYGYLDTPAMIAAIKQRYAGHSILVYPDASGNSRKSVNASESDISLLRQANFTVLVNARNPFVRDRVLSVNVKLKKNELFVNVDKCPKLVDTLEQQAYDKNGEPDKSAGLDHMADCLGYYINYRFPVAGSGAGSFKLKGL